MVFASDSVLVHDLAPDESAAGYMAPASCQDEKGSIGCRELTHSGTVVLDLVTEAEVPGMLPDVVLD